MLSNEELYQNYIIGQTPNLVLSYKGPFLEEILAKLSDIIRETFTQDPVISRKLLSIFIEMAQNVYYYSGESIPLAGKEYGIGYVIVSQEPNDIFKFTTGNFIPMTRVDGLIESCERINSLDREGLRQLKREVRSSEPGSEVSKGAGIGLIQIALTATEPMEYEVIPYDSEKSFFFITIKIKA
ncbi:MAG: SiaB family protein kinase [Cytophagales bacterium]|nr:SiaB family protein kinase [Cytophagales bacterium]